MNLTMVELKFGICNNDHMQEEETDLLVPDAMKYIEKERCACVWVGVWSGKGKPSLTLLHISVSASFALLSVPSFVFPSFIDSIIFVNRPMNPVVCSILKPHSFE